MCGAFSHCQVICCALCVSPDWTRQDGVEWLYQCDVYIYIYVYIYISIYIYIYIYICITPPPPPPPLSHRFCNVWEVLSNIGWGKCNVHDKSNEQSEYCIFPYCTQMETLCLSCWARVTDDSLAKSQHRVINWTNTRNFLPLELEATTQIQEGENLNWISSALNGNHMIALNKRHLKSQKRISPSNPPRKHWVNAWLLLEH